MDILVYVLCSGFVGSLGFISLEAALKSGNKSSYIFDRNVIKANSPTLALVIKNQPLTENEDGSIDIVPPA